MLTICLRILSLLGIILLALLLSALTMLLLVLFFPVTYRIKGAVDGTVTVDIRVKWLLGLLGIRYKYPDPGYLAVKLLCFPFYKMKLPPEETSHSSPAPEKEDPKSGESPAREELRAENAASFGTDGSAMEAMEAVSPERVAGSPEAVREEPEGQASGEEASASGLPGKILKILEKIKFTICGIYDKIKKIWNNISYYAELIQEEESRQLFTHAGGCLGKAVKSIRPRHIRAEILFGTGSPDTTGYLYGAYCMASAGLGSGVRVTPDFQEKVFQGNFDVSGRITIWILLWNAMRVLLDKRLRKLIRKLKAAPG